MNRKEIIQQIGQLESRNCDSCRIKSTKDYSLICINQCLIGKQIRELGKQLEGKKITKFTRGRKSLFDKDELTGMSKYMTGKEIAEKCNVSRQSVNYYMRKWKIPQKRGPVANITREKVEQLARDYTSEQIAKLLGCSKSTIRRYKSRWGIKGKNKKPGKEKKGA